jgi:hypothetical protein
LLAPIGGEEESIGPFWRPWRPRFGTHSDFPNSFGRLILGSPLYFSTHSSINSMIFRLGRESIHLSPSAARWVACVAALRNRATTARSSSEKPSSTPFISSM